MNPGCGFFSSFLPTSVKEGQVTWLLWVCLLLYKKRMAMSLGLWWGRNEMKHVHLHLASSAIELDFLHPSGCLSPSPSLCLLQLGPFETIQAQWTSPGSLSHVDSAHFPYERRGSSQPPSTLSPARPSWLPQPWASGFILHSLLGAHLEVGKEIIDKRDYIKVKNTVNKVEMTSNKRGWGGFQLISHRCEI